ncbi:MAG: hypothetical protein CSA62_09945 [Planctomycetota bacterium]|nr:MAG: hypothetical protein CSA62_09945 [Planctomycetota bacterium]
MKIFLASLALVGLSFSSAYAQCESECSSKAEKSSCSSQKACDSQEKSCSSKISFAKKLANMTAKERKQIVDAMGYLTKSCPMGRRLGSTTKALDELYTSAIANLKAVHASGKLNEAGMAQVAKSLGMLQKAKGLNAETLNGIALLVGGHAMKKDCGKGECGKGDCDKGDCDKGECGKGECDKGDCDKGECDKGDDGCVGCTGGCSSKAVATSDCSGSIAFSKRLCASWAKAHKELSELTAEQKAKRHGALSTLAPLGMIQSSMKNFVAQKHLVRAAVKTIPSSSTIRCPGTARVCDNGAQAVASVYALLNSVPAHGQAKSDCCKDKAGAKSDCCKDKAGAESDCCKDKAGAKSDCCKDKAGAKSDCCKEKAGAKSDCCKEKAGAKSDCCKDKAKAKVHQ